jgi:hypothetical protein
VIGERALICAGPNDCSEISPADHVKIVAAVNHAAVFPRAARSFTTGAPAPRLQACGPGSPRWSSASGSISWSGRGPSHA